MIAVIDTSVWIAALLSKNPSSASRLILKSVAARRVGLIWSRAMIEELQNTLARPKFALPTSVTSDLVGMLSRVAAEVEPPNVSYGCRDKSDDVLLGTAIRGNVRFLVTLDKDVLDPNFVATAARFKITILSAGAFVTELRRRGVISGNELRPDVSFLIANPSAALEPFFDELRDLFEVYISIEAEIGNESDEAERAIRSSSVAQIEGAVESVFAYLRQLFFSPLLTISSTLEGKTLEATAAVVAKAEVLAREGEGAVANRFFMCDLPDGQLPLFREAVALYNGVAARDEAIRQRSRA